MNILSVHEIQAELLGGDDRYPLTPEHRKAIVDALMLALKSPDCSEGEVIQIARIALHMEEINMRRGF